jgi:hypothetical protein
VEHAPEGFAWTQESWGHGLRADALAQVAAHVFTTRDLPLASDEGQWAHHPDLFPSYRRDREHAGRMAAAIRARGNPGRDAMTLREKIGSAVSRVLRSV